MLLSVYESKEQNDSSTKLSLFGAAAVLAGELEKSQELPLHLDFVGRVFPAGVNIGRMTPKMATLTQTWRFQTFSKHGFAMKA